MAFSFASPPPRAHRDARSGDRPLRSLALALLLALPSVLAFASCSLKDIHRDDCASNDQCVKLFGAGSTCDQGYCTDPITIIDPGCEQKTPDGRICNACPPKTQVEFLNACTSAACEPFDNKARVTKLTDDGGLPKLPPPPIPDASGQ